MPRTGSSPSVNRPARASGRALALARALASATVAVLVLAGGVDAVDSASAAATCPVSHPQSRPFIPGDLTLAAEVAKVLACTSPLGWPTVVVNGSSQPLLLIAPSGTSATIESFGSPATTQLRNQTVRDSFFPVSFARDVVGVALPGESIRVDAFASSISFTFDAELALRVAAVDATISYIRVQATKAIAGNSRARAAIAECASGVVDVVWDASEVTERLKKSLFGGTRCAAAITKAGLPNPGRSFPLRAVEVQTKLESLVSKIGQFQKAQTLARILGVIR